MSDLSSMTARGLPRRARGFHRHKQRAGLTFLLPLLLVWGLFLILPICETAYYSLMQWDGLSASWNGIGNYLHLWRSPDFGAVFINNLLLLLSVPFAVFIPFCIAIVIAMEPPGWRWVRALIFLPATLSWVVIGIVWLQVYSSDGLINQALDALGLHRFHIDPLGSVHTAIIPIALTFIWSQVGQNTLIFLIGLSGIDASVFEAATIDGAGLIATIRQIVLPLMTRFLVFTTIITLIAAFTALFSLIFVMTGGGPGFSTTTMEFYIYRLAFNQTDFGMGATVGIVLLCVIAIATAPLMMLYRRTTA
ncbi:carbohydrate ABC transporter permease [Acidisoma silvae]|uniref:Sugar ABC transporter permease n=1 Tax=Acidisoma silvae TaxID=2802396 RepID=A0A963YPU0_9PROT|nr:sugar ABC transporter permease [Acidisoma silvae]MCB8874597.1 sugar ABC transporter permease [Acidisoma silvae]